MRLLPHPLVALLLYLAMIAVWHLPAWYDRAQGQSALHEAEHALFLGTALLYWWPVVLDQQPGGIAMWLGDGLVYAGWVFVCFGRLVRREERAWARRPPEVPGR